MFEWLRVFPIMLILSWSTVDAHAEGSMPSQNDLANLLNDTMSAVSLGNKTGDYQVLYSHLTDGVQAKLDPAQIANAMKSFREKQIDMPLVLQLSPIITKTEMDETGLVKMAGYYPSQPLMVRFSFGFRKLNEVWRLEILNLDTPSNPNASMSTSQYGSTSGSDLSTGAPQSAQSSKIRSGKADPRAIRKPRKPTTQPDSGMPIGRSVNEPPLTTNW